MTVDPCGRIDVQVQLRHVCSSYFFVEGHNHPADRERDQRGDGRKRHSPLSINELYQMAPARCFSASLRALPMFVNTVTAGRAP